MNAVICLALKDLKLLLRDRLGLFFILPFPVIMGLFFGYINKSLGGPSRSRAIKIAVIDNDQSDMSKRFVGQLQSVPSLAPEPMAREQAADLVRKGSLTGYIELPKAFGKTAGIMWEDPPAIEIGIDPSRRAEAAMLEGFVMQAMGALAQQRFTDPDGLRPRIQEVIQELGDSPERNDSNTLLVQTFLGALDGFLQSTAQYMETQKQRGTSAMPNMALTQVNVVEITAPATGIRALVRKIRSPWDISFPPAIMWGIMGCVAGFAVSLVRERSGGTMLRLRIAPISQAQILAGKALACFLSVIGVVVAMVLLGKLLGMQINSAPLLVVATICIASGFVGMMMLLSVIGKTEQAVGGAGWGIIVVMCMFGGGMVPLAFMPPFMQTASHLSPVKWGIYALEGAIWRGFSPMEMLVPCFILIGIGTASFLAGLTILVRARV